MPELPDLTVFAENLGKRVTKKMIRSVTCGRNLRLNVSPRELAESLQDQVIEGVERWGKEIRFLLGNGKILHVHLMLTGGFVITGKPDKVPFPQLVIGFEDDTSLVVTDEKAMAMAALDPEKAEASPDALAVTVDELKRLISRFPKAKAKAFLIDQKVMRGIGNAYADEILWEARISPLSLMGKLTPQTIEVLAEKIPAVLQWAIVSIKERNPGITAGEIRDFLQVHNPSRKTSPTGRPIIKEKIAQKTTYYTDEQKLYV
ncbi:formamidopyrimidine-DNA glycosylase [Geotalea daltonii FRC-32]|uniref:Formamidopyrimidine-DNA glycosylase n=1 Tax=Geotalea daltonii (strain DSM 22248 / JCM 15807 / FRC-32) TaxID=316067 RepID=B9M9A3_GEODF|nr:DNA-formamidopyrimidine glycosylase family protein [Geotalea daltonii]ACM18661.1 formamidopyrimidine-DNA glycosylase [Geotalea daltonii FRC-32]